MASYWAYRGSNDLVYIVEDDASPFGEVGFKNRIDLGLKKLLTMKNLDVLEPYTRKHLFKVPVVWSKLLSIEIQGKKTMDDLDKTAKKALETGDWGPHLAVRLHAKFYFKVEWLLQVMTAQGVDKLFKPKVYSKNFYEIVSYYEDDGITSSADTLFSEEEAAKPKDKHNVIVVKKVADFVNGLGSKKLPESKNTYIFSSKYENQIREEKGMSARE